MELFRNHFKMLGKKLSTMMILGFAFATARLDLDPITFRNLKTNDE